MQSTLFEKSGSALAPRGGAGGGADTAPQVEGARAPKSPDEFQRPAVENGEGPLLVVAGPGTGKTFVIQHRVLHLIRKLGVEPDKILCLTFTEKAAEEMRGRVEAALAEADIAGQPKVETFHAFCAELLREFPVESDLRAASASSRGRGSCASS